MRRGGVECRECQRQKEPYISEAKKAVYKALKNGELAPPWLFFCVDCGKPATVWEHRDYGKPLDVEPCCKGCNTRRGPGDWPGPHRVG